MKNKICKISLFSAILACVAATSSDARVTAKNSNRSYAEAYNQVNALRYQQEYMNANQQIATTASTTSYLPVAVDDEQLANAIMNNSSDVATVSDLEACSMIYPNGVFRWGLPLSGIRKNQTPQCLAVVTLVDARGSEPYPVLATTTVAAGDTMKCNIDMFPESRMSASALSKVELPADKAPTMEDVEAVMNQEQRQNAGIKIATAAIISGVAGNILAPKNAGDNKLFGTSKTQIQDTALGAVAGAGIMAASTYSGKVAGDTIKSTAVNAASGMVLGNMLAGASGSDSVLHLTKCTVNKVEKDCVVGKISVATKNDTTITSGNGYPIENNEYNYIYIVKHNGSTVLQCYLTQTTVNGEDKYLEPYICRPATGNFVNISIKNAKKGNLAKSQMQPADFDRSDMVFVPKDEDSQDKFIQRYYEDEKDFDSVYYVISSAQKISGAARPAYAVFDSAVDSKAFGYKIADWEKLKKDKKTKYYLRNVSDGSVGVIQEENDTTTVYFEPASKSAGDGNLVDISNEARAKGTLVGTAAGGAMGGFAGYQGAKSEITERWIAATEEYKGSLTNFVCTTGNRFLAKYNDYLEIPDPQKSDEQ